MAWEDVKLTPEFLAYRGTKITEGQLRKTRSGLTIKQSLPRKAWRPLESGDQTEVGRTTGKLTADQVREIRDRYDAGELVVTIVADYPVSYNAVMNLLIGTTYKWVD